MPVGRSRYRSGVAGIGRATKDVTKGVTKGVEPLAKNTKWWEKLASPEFEGALALVGLGMKFLSFASRDKTKVKKVDY